MTSRALLCLLAACGPTGSSAPQIDPIEDQIASVGTELRVELRASDAEARQVSYAFAAEGPGGSLDGRATLRPYGDGSTAFFQFTPQARDVGRWTVTFEASAGSGATTETIQIEVRTADVADKAPRFRRPMPRGGTVLDLGKKDCLELDVLVEDLDTTGVEIRQAEPRIEGATLTQPPGHATATWRWCPTPAQQVAADDYRLNLEADDHDGNVAPTYFTIHLRQPAKPDCPGALPVIQHTPEDVTSVLPQFLYADITDDRELKRVMFYFSETDPGPSPSPDAFEQSFEMLRLEGDTWGADPPNPVAAMATGAKKTLYYLIVVEDNDDVAGSCDHVVQSPVYHATYTNPGTPGLAGLCMTCTSDQQCGGADDHCIRVATGTSLLNCGRKCAADADCPTGYGCSDNPLTSAGGVVARQCVPDRGTCEAPSSQTSCVDDAYEENDTLPSVWGKPKIPDEVDAQLCPSLSPGIYDTDWYKLVVPEDANVLLGLEAPGSANLSLTLVDDEGFVEVSSDGPTSAEIIDRCLPSGVYFVRVAARPEEEATGVPYSLVQVSESATCADPNLCNDDAKEDDDDPVNARPVTVFPHKTVAQQICSGDEDWYRVTLAQGETAHVRARFTQSAPDEDLDLVVYSQGGILLTHCVEGDVEDCDAENGQSVDSDEYLTYTNTGPTTTFNFVVRGYDGAQNSYDLCIGKSAAQCP